MQMCLREQKGLEICLISQNIRRENSRLYKVRSQSSPKTYSVTRDGLSWTCSCPDFTFRHVICKHIFSVQFSTQYRKQVKISSPVFYQEQESKPCCPKCHNPKFKKDGNRYTKFGKIQRYSCLVCHYKFVQRDGFEGMKQDPKVITLCMDLYFKGVSLREIKDHLAQFYSVNVQHTTIYYWIKRYVKLMKKYLDQFTPNVSGVWHVDESIVNVRGSMMKGRGNYDWLWNLMDHETRFILSSKIHKARFIDDARDVLKESREKAGKVPFIIVTDSLRSYSQAIKKEIGTKKFPKVEHLKVSPIREGMQNMPIERWHSTLKQRLKVMRGMNDSNSAQDIADGFALYYNFIRKHSAIGKTPAEEADIDLSLSGNRWESLIKKARRR